MELPKYHETFIQILEVLSDGKLIHHNELRKIVRDRYYSDLPASLLEMKTKNGDLVILNRIGWGKAYLKQGKFLEQPERGVVKITDKGLVALKQGKLTLADLRKDSDYMAHEEAKKDEKDNSVDTFENASPEDLIDSGFAAIESQAKGDLLEKLRNMDPYYFEKVILLLLEKMGYGDLIETSKSGDGGIDGIINQDKLGLEKIYMQAKRYKEENKVREPQIRDFIGAMSRNTKKGVFVTTSSFDMSAVQKAKDAEHTIILVDGNKLAHLMYLYNVGVQIRNTFEIKELDEDFFEEN